MAEIPSYINISKVSKKIAGSKKQFTIRTETLKLKKWMELRKYIEAVNAQVEKDLSDFKPKEDTSKAIASLKKIKPRVTAEIKAEAKKGHKCVFGIRRQPIDLGDEWKYTCEVDGCFKTTTRKK